MTAIAGWLLSIALQGTALLSIAWLIDRALPTLRGAWRELIWRAALFGGVLTATLQVFSAQLPLAGRWDLAAPQETYTASMPDVLHAASTRSTASAPAMAGAVHAQTQDLPPGIAGDAAKRNAAKDSDLTKYTMPQMQQNRWPAWLVSLWLSGALLALIHTCASWLTMRSVLRHAEPLHEASLAQDLKALAQRAGMAVPRLLHLDGIASPIAITSRRIVLPAWSASGLERTQVKAMLAHELAHLVRRDPEWKLLVALWRALFWFLPLAALAQRRLDEIAELSCDASAAQCLDDPHDLAACLVRCAEQHSAKVRCFSLAPAMAARPSALITRIERLLEGVAMDTRHSGAGARTAALAIVVFAAAALPAIGFDTAAHAAAQDSARHDNSNAAAKHDKRGDHSSISIHSDDDGGRSSMTVSMSDDTHKFRANVEGEVAFNDEETDITSLGAGGSARLEETRGGVTERIEMSARGNTIERRYFVNDAQRPFDDKARALLATAVKELIRTGVNAEARAKRIYARGGAQAVLDEIDQIHSDYVRGLYLVVLAGLGPLSPGALDHALQLAGDMQTDYERRQALTALFDKQALDASQQVTFLHHASRFESDYERAELLIGMLPRLADTDQARQAWLEAGLGVKSDYERRRTLQSMLIKGGLDDAQLGRVLAASDSMQSDYEHRELLSAAAKQMHDADALAPAYTHSAQGIASDYEHREALLALIHTGKLGVQGSNAVLDSAAHIKSPYECREVLVALARVMPNDAHVVEHYRSVAAQLSQYERGEAEHALH